jgi:acyl carrier protein
LSGAGAAAVAVAFPTHYAQVVKQSDGTVDRCRAVGLWITEGTMDDIEGRIIELVAKSKNVPAESVRMESTFDELQVDSLDKINLSFAVEEMFGIEIPDESLNSLKTVGDVVRGVQQLRAAQSTDAAKT